MPVASTAQRNREYFPRIGTSTVATARSVLLHLPSASTLPMPLTSAQLVLALLTSKPTTIFTTSFVVISVTTKKEEKEKKETGGVHIPYTRRYNRLAGYTWRSNKSRSEKATQNLVMTCQRSGAGPQTPLEGRPARGLLSTVVSGPPTLIVERTAMQVWRRPGLKIQVRRL